MFWILVPIILLRKRYVQTGRSLYVRRNVWLKTFFSGTIPDDLKIALVTPIFKANENNEFKNYRPISVLTCFSKLLEKLMYKRLIYRIEKNNILTQHQYGFRENRSTELAIIELVDRVTKAIDRGEYTIGY